MTTPLYEIAELANGEINYTRANNAFRKLERGFAGRISINFETDANLTLSTTAGSEEWLDKFITLTDTSSPLILTAGRDVIFPAKSGPEYIITNDTAQTLTIKISGQTGFTIATGVTARGYYDGTDMVSGP